MNFADSDYFFLFHCVFKKSSSSQLRYIQNLCKLLKYNTDICLKIFPKNIHEMEKFER